MIWKIFFILSVVLITSTSLITALILDDSYIKSTVFDSTMGLLDSVGIAFTLSIFYSLGWKQKLLSQKSTNVFLWLFIIFIMALFAYIAILSYLESYTELHSKAGAIIISVILSLIFTAIINLPLIPFYIGIYKYKKNFDTFNVVEKPYWKVFSLYYIAMSLWTPIGILPKYTHFSQYNFIDFFVIFSSIYEAIFIIGFSWNKKIFNKLFWQITAIPYIILNVVSPFFISETFNQDFHIIEEILSNPVAIIEPIIMLIVPIFIIYKYAYSKEKISE